jgi:hypothetical protein
VTRGRGRSARDAAALLGVVLLFALRPVRLFAQGSPEDAPPPDSAAGLLSATEAEMALDTTQVELSARERRSRKNMGVWLLESQLTAQVRTFARYQERVTGEEPRGWAAGGWVRFRSGRWHDWLAFRTGLYMSVRLIGDTAHGNTQILAPDQGNLVSIGALNGEAYWKDNVFTVGAQELNLPLVNKSDSRMIPRTFVAAMGRGPLPLARWEYVAGYIGRMKDRDGDRFQPMSQFAGVAANRGLLTLGARRGAAGDRHLTGGFFEYYMPDVQNYGFGEISLETAPGKTTQLKIAAQATDFRSVGSLHPSGTFEAQHFTTRVAGSYRRIVAAVAASTTTGTTELVDPYGLFPSYTSLMGSDFTRSGESAFAVTGSYNLGDLVAPGLTVFLGYGHGSGGLDPLSSQRFWRDLLEVTFDYRPPSGPMLGLWFRARGAHITQDGPNPDGYDLRVIGYWDVPLRWPPPSSAPRPPAPRQ